MRPEQFEWGTGVVRQWDLATFDPERPPYPHDLKEDLAQIEYPAGVVIDIGWYPEFDRSGTFTLVVVENQDWEVPRYRTRCSSVAALCRAIPEAVRAAEGRGMSVGV